LNSIRTLGFRGEALAAIAAVSQVTVVSRAAGDEAGTRLVLDGGKLRSRDSVGAPQGTVMAVERLFYNTPARLKFLKSVATEKRLIDEFVTRFALAYPGIRFRLTHNNRIALHTSGNGDLREVLVAVYGPETARELLPVGDFEMETELMGKVEIGPDPIRVTGFAGPPSLHRANRNGITLFVNGRSIKDSSLTYAVIQAYHTLLPTKRYPMAILFISMTPEEVDVNVHPAKTEVRFRHPNGVFGAVQRTVRRTLVEESPIRGTGAWATSPAVESASLGWEGALDQRAFGRRESRPQSELNLDWSPGMPEARGERSDSPASQLGGRGLPVMRVVGQVGAAYIITEGPDGLFLIDQHAAHERILYEKYVAEWAKRQVASQGLVAGAAVYLSPAQTTLLEDHQELLATLGFQVELFGPNGFMVRAMPAVVGNLDPANALLSVVDDLEKGETPLRGKIEEKIILRVCKTAAIKAGQTLSRQEMEAMIGQLEACHNPHTCPHGRPTLIHLSAAQLARQFGRM
jgi:DNA mismatch repair protein MutL